MQTRQTALEPVFSARPRLRAACGSPRRSHALFIKLAVLSAHLSLSPLNPARPLAAIFEGWGAGGRGGDFGTCFQ